MKYYSRRTPKNYDGTAKTAHHINDCLPRVLSNIGRVYHQRPDLLLAAWPEIIGERLSPMTKAVEFSDGILVVQVKNSTLHSLLSQNEKPRLLKILRQRFPKIGIKNIYFKMG